MTGMTLTDPTRPPAFSPVTVLQTEEFVQGIRQLRAVNPQADQFFREVFELMEDYENHHRDDLTDEHRYWLYRMGRILGRVGEDPFPTLTFTHPENGHDQ